MINTSARRALAAAVLALTVGGAAVGCTGVPTVLAPAPVPPVATQVAPAPVVAPPHVGAEALRVAPSPPKATPKPKAAKPKPTVRYSCDPAGVARFDDPARPNVITNKSCPKIQAEKEKRARTRPQTSGESQWDYGCAQGYITPEDCADPGRERSANY